MPTYEYECKSCSHNFEVFQSMSDSPLKVCPVCGKEVRRLIFGGAGVIFKGSGFYVTDKGKSSSHAPKKSESASSAAQASPCSQCPANSASGTEGGKCPAAHTEAFAEAKTGSRGDVSHTGRDGSSGRDVSAGRDGGHDSSSVKAKSESKSA